MPVFLDGSGEDDGNGEDERADGEHAHSVVLVGGDAQEHAYYGENGDEAGASHYLVVQTQTIPIPLAVRAAVYLQGVAAGKTK